MLKLLRFPEDIKVYLILNILSTTFLIEIIYFNENKIP